MLRPKAVEAYDQTLNSVVDDLITKLRLCRSSQGLVTDIASEFYRFGLEGEEELPTFMEQLHGFFCISSCFVWGKETLNRGYCFFKSDSFIRSFIVCQSAVTVALWPMEWTTPSESISSLVAGISSVLFESRIGCLDKIVPEETERFIQCINTMFVMTLLTMAMPSWMHRLFPKPWNVFCQCWDYMFDFGTSHRTAFGMRK